MSLLLLPFTLSLSLLYHGISSYTLALTEEGETERRGFLSSHWWIVPPAAPSQGDVRGQS